MSENQTQFRLITNLFYNGLYEEGRTLISQMIGQYPDNSMLYVNRALFSSQLGEDLSAMSDLESAIQINPFNYIAYFNLFSVLTRNNQDIEAYNNLCCSLSCMYLLKAKTTNNIGFADKSLEYCKNNIAAKFFKECLELNNNLGTKAEVTSNQKKNSYQVSLSNSQTPQFFRRVKETIGDNKKFKLQSNIQLPQDIDLIQQINSKVKEFNSLYMELNQSFGAVTQKVPKESHISNNIQTFMREKSKISSENKGSVIAILEDEDYFNEKSKKSDIKLNTLQGTNPESAEEISVNQPTNNRQKLNLNMEQNQFELSSKISCIIEQKSMQCDDQKISTGNNQAASIRNNLIYPLSNKIFLRITLLSFVYVQTPKKISNSTYCVVYYNDELKFRSCPTKCQDQRCIWNESFDPILVAPKPAVLKLKLYKKLFNDIHDQQIGEIEILVDMVDLLRLPIYNRDSDLIGQIMVHLQVVDKCQAVQ